jgi:hypothetical protein
MISALKLAGINVQAESTRANASCCTKDEVHFLGSFSYLHASDRPTVSGDPPAIHACPLRQVGQLVSCDGMRAANKVRCDLDNAHAPRGAVQSV